MRHLTNADCIAAFDRFMASIDGHKVMACYTAMHNPTEEDLRLLLHAVFTGGMVAAGEMIADALQESAIQ